jgi:hypothetical protein
MAASLASATRTTVTLPAKIPPASPAPQSSSPVPLRTSSLAVASLICSAGSFILIPFGFVPGIICGHMARHRLAQNLTLRGQGLAKAGLIVGYTALALYAVAVLLFFALGLSIVKK